MAADPVNAAAVLHGCMTAIPWQSLPATLAKLMR
jgi:hypothetical protein